MDDVELLELGINENELIEDVEMSDDELDRELRTLNNDEGGQTEHGQVCGVEKETESSIYYQKTEEVSIKKDGEFTKNHNTEFKVNEDKHKHSRTENSHSHSRQKEYYDHNGREDRYRHKRKSEFSSDIDKKRLYRPLEVTKSMDPMVVGREIAYRLHETKMNLIGHVVRVIGTPLALEVFSETKKLMQKGGLKTDSGDRKRSPGGLFLYILKNRGYASDAQMKEIFKVENEKIKENKKRKARTQRNRKRKDAQLSDGTRDDNT